MWLNPCHYPRWIRLTLLLAVVVLWRLVVTVTDHSSLKRPPSSTSLESPKIQNSTSRDDVYKDWQQHVKARLKGLQQQQTKNSIWKHNLLPEIMVNGEQPSSLEDFVKATRYENDKNTMVVPIITTNGWNSCTLLPKIVNNENKKRPFHITVLGGSSAARPADHCSNDNNNDNNNNMYENEKDDPRAGRYSNILQAELQRDNILFGNEVRVSNMAQGSTTSVWSGFFLDQLLPFSSTSTNLTTTDLIIWDHAINDYAPSTTSKPADWNGNQQEPAPAQMLRFFLTRVQTLYAKAQQPTPPILLVYVWKQDIGYKSNADVMAHGIDHFTAYPEAYDASFQVVQEFLAKGMSIQWLDVARLIARQVFVDQRRAILDDRHHPACAGSHWIADWIQFVMYKNLQLGLEELSFNSHSKINHATDCLSLETTTTTKSSTLEAMNSRSLPLSDLLLRSTAKIGAFAQWQPLLVTPTSHSLQQQKTLMRITSTSLQRAEPFLANIFPAADMPGRDDRKYAYKMPHCDPLDNIFLSLTFVIHDSDHDDSIVVARTDLKWLGLVTTGNTNKIVLRINNHTVPLTGNTEMARWAISVNLPRAHQDWIPIHHDHNHRVSSVTSSSDGIPQAQDGQYRLDFCDATTEKHLATEGATTAEKKQRHMWVHQIIGVMTTE